MRADENKRPVLEPVNMPSDRRFQGEVKRDLGGVQTLGFQRLRLLLRDKAAKVRSRNPHRIGGIRKDPRFPIDVPEYRAQHVMLREYALDRSDDPRLVDTVEGP